MLTLGSLFDGIGGWLLSAQRSGIKPIWSSEIEKFPMAVTAYHFPEVKQMGDINLLDGATLPPVDIITAGSPCQNFSTAQWAYRKGLDGEKSGLLKTAIGLVHRMRNATGGRFPRWFVWENVCGAFSTNSGADYRAVLQEITKACIPMPENNKWADAGLVQCDGCEVAWRVLDASGWGLPQRRRRIFLAANFSESGGCAKEVLLIPQGLYGDGTEVCCAWEKPASTAEKSTRTASRVINEGGNLAVKIRSGKGEGKAGKGALIGIEQSFTLGAVQDQTLFQEDDKGGYVIRRFMPLEQERLQGLPDNWTYLPDNKLCSNAVRYKAIGNGMAQPCSDWILKRIAEVEREDKNE